ncbi:MAG TPA: hypothetical protein VN260_08190 [Dissulfurispiraceae bacterium]|nr:hypothetical protein [Dissulfurispiraceae bacterium]
MRNLLGLMIGTALIILASQSAQGNPEDPGIRNRIHEQQQRIDQGVASGQLTPAEARRAQANLNRIRAEEDRLKADGTLTKQERVHLQRELDRSSDSIYHKKHNQKRR